MPFSSAGQCFKFVTDKMFRVFFLLCFDVMFDKFSNFVFDFVLDYVLNLFGILWITIDNIGFSLSVSVKFKNNQL